VEALRAIFATRTQAQWIAAFQGHDCCVTPVLGLDEALDDPQHRAREMFVRARHPAAGDVLQFAPPFKLSRFDFEVERPAPAPGEHAGEILEALGYDAARIAGLRARGVV
jgi:crotonobetainyl-CoA:carnitine CoA-transferase CaiB-like acyl-CoA transferase